AAKGAARAAIRVAVARMDRGDACSCAGGGGSGGVSAPTAPRRPDPRRGAHPARPGPPPAPRGPPAPACGPPAPALPHEPRDLARLEDDRALILAGVSHDLRTPLARLRLGVEMSQVDPQLKNGMTADIDEMDRIIGQFLDFARVAGGEPTAPTDLAALAREVAGRYREGGHALREEIEPTPDATLRPLAVRRLIGNLLDHALR